MPMKATASSSAATMNILASSAGASSGWRAMPSRKRPPRMPKPMAVPSAPRPKMMPTASTVIPSMCAMFSIQLSRYQTVSIPIAKTLVMLGGLRQVDDGEHHEYEGLQSAYEQVEQRPEQADDHRADDVQPADGRVEGRKARGQGQQGDEHEYHLARIHVAVEPQCQGYGPGKEGRQLHDQIHGYAGNAQQDIGLLAAGRERMHRQLAEESTQALHLDAVENDEQEHRQRQRKHDVQVDAGHDAQMPEAGGTGGTGQQIDRQDVHHIEQEHPAEDRQ